ncbi:MAG: adenylate/guanylate cyclase domain-containing protein [Xanthobacteraceae bacterium]
MTGERVERRLAAVLAADVAGYSRLMGADEEDTLARLKAVRKTLIDPTIAAHRGRIVKTTGDGLLVEFASAVDAARSAIEVQRGMAEQNASVPQDERIELRIGIHVGDIIFDENDIFGDGVNIAARLEGIAEPGGVCISDDAHRHIRGKVDIVFDDMGPQALKNITEPMRAWRCQINANASSAAPTKSSVEIIQPLAITDKPSIAVLPFTCFSEEREFKFLTEAMSEDLITMLARIPGFIVIARQSTFAYQGRSVDSRQIGRELGVRYIIEGSLRPVGQQLRVGTQLIDATTGAQLWADRFDGQAEDVLELQDQIVRAIASRIEPELVRAEVALIRRRRDANPNAWSCFRQGAGLISLKGWSEETLTQATALLRQATTLDPDFALARAQLALFLSLGARLGLVADGASVVTEARTEAERAVAIDHDASEVLGYAGCALAELGDVQRGTEILERAIENDPSNAQAWVALGTSLCFLEKMDATGLEKLRHGMRLSPRDHRLGFWGTFYALALARHSRPTEAHEEIRAACRRDPQFYVARVVLALIAAGLGSREEAVVALREARRLRPRLSLNEIQLLVGRRAALLAPLWNEVSKSLQ